MSRYITTESTDGSVWEIDRGSTADMISVSHKTWDTLQDDALELRGVLTVLDSRMRAVSKWETAEDPDSISVPRAAWNAMFDDVQDLRDIRMAMQARLDSAQSRAAGDVVSRYVKAVSSKDGSTWEIDRAMGAGIRDRILHVAGDQSFSHKTDDARLFSTGEVEAVCSCFARLKTYVDARGTHAEPSVEDKPVTDQPSMPSGVGDAVGQAAGRTGGRRRGFAGLAADHAGTAQQPVDLGTEDAMTSRFVKIENTWLNPALVESVGEHLDHALAHIVMASGATLCPALSVDDVVALLLGGDVML